MKRSLAALALVLGCTKSGDVRAPFNTDWLNDGGQSIAEVERRVRAAPPPPQVNLAVGVTADSLVGLPLDGGRRWTQRAKLDVLPSVAGDLVVYTAGGELHALDARTGAARWSVDVDDYELRGAGDDGSTTVATLGRPSRRGSLLVAVRRDGSVRARVETQAELGRPAARGGVAFVPWSGQYVSALDLEAGEELGRLLARELTSHALTAGGEIFFGETGVLHLDERLRYATTNQSLRTALPKRVLPGNPQWLAPGAELPRIDVGARAKIRVVAAPVWTGSETRFASDRFVATYFRAVMAFDAKSAALSWVRAETDDVVGGAAAKSGFVLCAASGKALRVGASGGDAGEQDLGAKLRGCVVEASSFVVPDSPVAGSLAQQIERALGELDPEMAAAQAFLVTELGRLPDPIVTKTLIELTTSSRIPPDVRARARTLLAQRKTGVEFMLAALERRYDFLSGALLPPPVGPLAEALLASGERRAAPLLARHLNDPSTDSADVEQAARSLSKLAGPEELSSLRTFFALYRATADEPALVSAVISVAEALLRIGGEEGRAVVERAARDPLTQPEVARGLARLTAAPVASAAGIHSPD